MIKKNHVILRLLAEDSNFTEHMDMDASPKLAQHDNAQVCHSKIIFFHFGKITRYR
ncbi:hypothetical protein [Chloroherpeton thalassium]|uniref:hypothetical protein n=1 Tax=Chloroherpeton thalassium TaxID=100716 RepID=UPI0002EF8513|nr:hypothetical protein [Chloroherpeton thalassium]